MTTNNPSRYWAYINASPRRQLEQSVLSFALKRGKGRDSASYRYYDDLFQSAVKRLQQNYAASDE